VFSKIRNLHAGLLPACDKSFLVSDLESLFKGGLSNLEALPGGTLGACFKGSIDADKYVFKTNLFESGESALKREYEFLSNLYSTSVNPSLHISNHSGVNRHWLQMNELIRKTDLDTSQVQDLVLQFESKISSSNFESRIPQNESIDKLVEIAISNLNSLSCEMLISNSIYKATLDHLQHLQFSLPNYPRQICHGDLGPENIMISKNLDIIALDWEDVFWGINGYDYLYWLTFYNNRVFLKRSALGHNNLPINLEISIMVAIIILKCFLSYKNGSYTKNNLTFNQRISEVINLA